MSEQPMKPLRDDPDALAALGVRLDDPALTPKPLDLTALETRLLQGMAAADAALDLSAAASSGWSGLIIKGASILSAMVLGGVLHATWMQFNPAPQPPPLVIPQPILVAMAPVTPVVAPVAPRPTVPVVKPFVPAVAPVPSPLTVQPEVMGLAEQLRLYESGRTALNAGNHAVALREFDRYVRTIPDGDLWPEAALGLMQALRGTEEWGRLDSWCTTLLEDSRLASHKRRILQQRGRARAHVGACQGAEQDVFRGHQDPQERAAAMEEVRGLCGTAY